MAFWHKSILLVSYWSIVFLHVETSKNDGTFTTMCPHHFNRKNHFCKSEWFKMLGPLILSWFPTVKIRSTFYTLTPIFQLSPQTIFVRLSFSFSFIFLFFLFFLSFLVLSIFLLLLFNLICLLSFLVSLIFSSCFCFIFSFFLFYRSVISFFLLFLLFSFLIFL